MIAQPSHRWRSDHCRAVEPRAIESDTHGKSAVFIATEARLLKAVLAHEDVGSADIGACLVVPSALS